MPVNSDHERRAFRTLRTTLWFLSKVFPAAAFELVKPVFDIATPEGTCLPDFLIRARRGGELLLLFEVLAVKRILVGQPHSGRGLSRAGTTRRWSSRCCFSTSPASTGCRTLTARRRLEVPGPMQTLKRR